MQIPPCTDLQILNISAARRAEISFVCGLIQDEISQEHGNVVCVNDVFAGAMSSPYLRNDNERIYVVGTLAYLVGSEKYWAVHMAHKACRYDMQRKHPGISVDEEIVRYRDEILTLGGDAR